LRRWWTHFPHPATSYVTLSMTRSVESKTSDQVVLDVRKVPIYESTVPKRNRTTADIVGVQGAAKAATERFHRERLNHVLNRVLRHNLRNDMNVIGGFSEVLEKRLSGENAELAERIAGTSDRLSQLSESARKLSENMDLAPELEPMDITPMVERCGQPNHRAISRRRYHGENAQQDSGSEYPQFGNGCLGIA